MSLPDDDLLSVIGEVLRCARGVSRSSRPGATGEAPASVWLDALARSLVTLDALENWGAAGTPEDTP